MSRRAPVTETDVTSALIRASSDQTPRPAGRDRAVVPRRAVPRRRYLSLDAPRLAAARRGWSTMQTRADSRSVEKVKLFCSNACATSAKGAWQVRRVATNTDGRAVVACSARAPFAARGRGGCTLPCAPQRSISRPQRRTRSRAGPHSTSTPFCRGEGVRRR